MAQPPIYSKISTPPIADTAYDGFEMASFPHDPESYSIRGPSDGDPKQSTSASDSFLDHGSIGSSTRRAQRRLSPFERLQRAFPTGWRVGVYTGAVVVSVVLVVNVILTIWSTRNLKVDDGFGLIYEGSCARTKTIDLWVHLLINVLSTLLLGASNYTMQCLSAPTREDVQKAHAKHIWLDIGVPSIRNLFRIKVNRLVLWCLLGCSSIPLHLMFNSAVFSTIAANDYAAISLPEAAIESPVANITEHFTVKSGDDHYSIAQLTPVAESLYDRIKTYERLENAACIKAYAQEFLTDRRDVVLVVAPGKHKDSTKVIDFEFAYTATGNGVFSHPYPWMCRLDYNNDLDQCGTHVDELVKSPDTWLTDLGRHPKYCLSQKVEQRCKIQFSIQIMVIVIICNIVKAVVMLVTVLTCKQRPLVTVGDAIASFLTTKDPYTEGMCLAAQTYFDVRYRWPMFLPQRWVRTSPRWYKSPSLRRWIFCNVLFLLAITASIFLLFFAKARIYGPSDWASLYKLGLGSVNSQAIIAGWAIPASGTSGLVANVLIANIPQLVLSFVYLAYNGLYTSMLLSAEWNDFALERKPLRVSDPVHDQRSSYFLQLPYRFAIPLLLLSGILHWLLSQSIFLARVSAFNWSPTLPLGIPAKQLAISTCGYSPIAILLVILLAIIMVIAALATGLVPRLKPGIPLAGSNSAAIAAACHPPPEDVDAAVLAVRWGVVPAREDVPGAVRHCAFSSGPVEMPNEQTWYAGMKEKAA